MQQHISSTANPAIKNLKLLMENNRKRRAQQLVIVEGAKETTAALSTGYKLKECYVCPDLLKDTTLETILGDKAHGDASCYTITPKVYESLAYRESRDGIVAVFEAKSHALSDLQLPENPLILVLEAVEKPGNLGAVLRTADAAGVSAVIVCDPLADVYNPNVIRSGVGCVFYMPVAIATAAEAIAWLQEQRIRILATALPATQDYTGFDYTEAIAIVMGSEAHGLTPVWFEQSDALIKIPMLGRTDSLNVSTSAAIVAFEAVRQRRG